MSLTRRSTLGLMTCAVVAPTVLRAQSFPTQPISLVVPYPAGGPTDAIARFVAQEMSATIGQNVLVENRAGASGAVGTRAVAKAPPDGHTIIFGNNQTHGNNMFLLKEPGYDAVRDFAPLCGVGAFEHAFVVRNDLPAKSIAELVALAKAEADGHTFIFGNNQTHGNNMFLLKEPGYDAIKDFAPLAGAGAFPHALVVKNDLPVKTLAELIALARKDPGKLNYGSTGNGSGSHLSTELLMKRTGIEMQHIPYKGAPPLVQDIIGGRIDVSLSTLPSVLKQIEAGQMRALGVASAARAPQLKDVPTFREQGVSNADAESWAAFFAPAKVPTPVLERLSKEIVAALKSAAVAEKINALGFALNVRAPAEFGPYLKQEIDTWAEIIKAAGIKAE